MAWDGTLRSTSEHKTDEQLAQLVYDKFKIGDTGEGIRYTLGGLYCRPIVVTYVSKMALQNVIQVNPKAYVPGKGICLNRLQVNKMRVTREHIIPVASLYSHLEKKFKEGTLSKKYILGLFPKLIMTVLTLDENKKLKQCGLNSKMPEGWWESKDLNPFDRYHEAGLNDDIWADL